MQIVSTGDNLHEMSYPVFRKKKKKKRKKKKKKEKKNIINLSSAEFAAGWLRW